MKTTRLTILIAAAVISALTVIAQAQDPKIEKKQKEIRNMAQDTLQRLYEADPKAQSAVERRAG